MHNRSLETGMIRSISIDRLIIILFLLLSIGYAQEDSVKVKNPKTAGYLGLLFPGAGQVYNGKIVKAGIIIALEIASYNQFQKNRENYTNYDKNDPVRRTRYLEKRNKFAWWMGFIYIYGVLDAIVDAHLYQFDEIMDENLEGEGTKEEGTL